jgi:DNA mismatch repair ATPase MutL
MDQHAVNERINYEYYLEELGREKKEVIDLLVPLK